MNNNYAVTFYLIEEDHVKSLVAYLTTTGVRNLREIVNKVKKGEGEEELATFFRERFYDIETGCLMDNLTGIDSVKIEILTLETLL